MRYTDNFISALKADQQKTQDPQKLLDFYIKQFRKPLVEDGNMCLCGMLGAEIDSLPTLVA